MFAFLGNHGVAHLGNAPASGQIPQASFGYGVCHGQAGDSGVISSLNMGLVQGRFNLGLYLQSTDKVKLSFTLHPQPESEEALWGNEMSLDAPNIEMLSLAFTGIKVEFEAPGSLFLGVM